MVVEQAPFRLELQFLPQHLLSKAHAIKTDSVEATSTFRLRLTSLQKHEAVGDLLRQGAPAEWTASELQYALQYQLDSTVTLVVDNQKYAPVLATTETTVDTDREVTLLLVFPVPERMLLQSSTANIEVSRAFYLPAPVRFTLPLANF